jgi:hypothetical protein
MLNVVRHNDYLRLIDFDASIKIFEKEDVSYVGLKFSSGSLPPEVGAANFLIGDLLCAYSRRCYPFLLMCSSH